MSVYSNGIIETSLLSVLESQRLGDLFIILYIL